MDKYLQDRAALIAEDRIWRRDSQAVHINALGPLELLEKADKILREIRKQEEVSVWANETTHRNIYQGMEFLTAKETIQQTRVFQLMKKLPKGALLHAHMDATCDAAFLLRTALMEPQMHIRTTAVVTQNTAKTVLPEFIAFPVDFKTESHFSVTDLNYEPGKWALMSTARAGFSEAMGGPDGFDQWVLASLRIDPEEAYVQYNTSKKIWESSSLLSVLRGHGLLGYEPTLRKYLRELLVSSIEDGISYVEMRFNFFPKTIIRANGADDFNGHECIQMLDEVIKDVRADMDAQGRGDEFVGAKVIYITLRFITPEELQWYLDECVELKKAFPHLIAGFDLVGQEDYGHPLLYYLPKLLEFQDRVKAEGLSIPFVFHAGETLGDGDRVDDNLYDALLLGTRRIGHGFSIVKHPHLMKLCRERNITIEVCPISNEILRLTSSMPAHPLPIMLNNGVPVALCSDDPAVFGNLGLSYDYFQVFVSSEITGLATLGVMARESIMLSELEPEAKTDAAAKWDRRWRHFLEEVVALGSSK